MYTHSMSSFASADYHLWVIYRALNPLIVSSITRNFSGSVSPKGLVWRGEFISQNPSAGNIVIIPAVKGRVVSHDALCTWRRISAIASSAVMS